MTIEHLSPSFRIQRVLAKHDSKYLSRRDSSNLVIFEIQNSQTIPLAKFVRRLGMLPDEDLERIEATLRKWLGL